MTPRVIASRTSATDLPEKSSRSAVCPAAEPAFCAVPAALPARRRAGVERVWAALRPLLLRVEELLRELPPERDDDERLVEPPDRDVDEREDDERLEEPPERDELPEREPVDRDDPPEPELDEREPEPELDERDDPPDRDERDEPEPDRDEPERDEPERDDDEREPDDDEREPDERPPDRPPLDDPPPLPPDDSAMTCLLDPPDTKFVRDYFMPTTAATI